jgi:hypothetical protein
MVLSSAVYCGLAVVVTDGPEAAELYHQAQQESLVVTVTSKKQDMYNSTDT